MCALIEQTKQISFWVYLCVMEMELNLALNQSNYIFFVKMIGITKFQNPKNKFQDSTKDFIRTKKIKTKIKSSF